MIILKGLRRIRISLASLVVKWIGEPSICTLRYQINTPPPPIKFSIFFQLPRSYQDPLFTNIKEIDNFTNPLFHFISLLVLFRPNIQGRMECFCIYCSSMLNDNLFLFFSSFYTHLQLFLKFQLPSLVY